jgi:hypothetical protein
VYFYVSTILLYINITNNYQIVKPDIYLNKDGVIQYTYNSIIVIHIGYCSNWQSKYEYLENIERNH